MFKAADKVVVQKFDQLKQLLDFFPARNLKADFFLLQSKESLGAHRTLNKREVIGVLQGIAYVIIDTEVYKLKKDEMIYVPRGKVCNVYNKNQLKLKIIFIVSRLDY